MFCLKAGSSMDEDILPFVNGSEWNHQGPRSPAGRQLVLPPVLFPAFNSGSFYSIKCLQFLSSSLFPDGPVVYFYIWTKEHTFRGNFWMFIIWTYQSIALRIHRFRSVLGSTVLRSCVPTVLGANPSREDVVRIAADSKLNLRNWVRECGVRSVADMCPSPQRVRWSVFSPWTSVYSYI
jgi:hypothetical protein